MCGHVSSFLVPSTVRGVFMLYMHYIVCSNRQDFSPPLYEIPYRASSNESVDILHVARLDKICGPYIHVRTLRNV